MDASPVILDTPLRALHERQERDRQEALLRAEQEYARLSERARQLINDGSWRQAKATLQAITVLCEKHGWADRQQANADAVEGVGQHEMQQQQEEKEHRERVCREAEDRQKQEPLVTRYQRVELTRHETDVMAELERLAGTAIPPVKKVEYNSFGFVASGGHVTGLDLYNKKLTSLPGTIGNLASLKELKLIYNQLSSLPDTIGNLTALKELYLYSNKLTSLPEIITRMTWLKEIYLEERNWNLAQLSLKKREGINSRGCQYEVLKKVSKNSYKLLKLRKQDFMKKTAKDLERIRKILEIEEGRFTVHQPTDKMLRNFIDEQITLINEVKEEQITSSSSFLLPRKILSWLKLKLETGLIDATGNRRFNPILVEIEAWPAIK